MMSSRNVVACAKKIVENRLSLCRASYYKTLVKTPTRGILCRGFRQETFTQRILPLHKVNARLYSSTANTQPEPGSAEEPNGELVYSGSINTGVLVAKYFSLSSSAIGVCLQPWIISQMASSALVFKVAMVSSTGIFVFGTPFLLHFLCKRYVTEMYYNEHTRTFTATRLNFFARRKKLSFKPEEIRESLSSPFCNYEVRDHSLLLDTDVLKHRHPRVYVVFMGYDEPLDLDKYMSPKSK